MPAPGSPRPLSLTDLTPPRQALPDFAPPPRFGLTTFAGYRPQHPTQQAALERTERFVRAVTEPEGFRWPWQNPAQGKGLYLDGGFGVGKTHLLAAAYSACAVAADQKLYCSFAELVHVIGVLSVAEAKKELGARKLYCIDEFELDDPGNTLIVKTFLAHVFGCGGSVVTTSNTQPEAQGQGRFNANDFKREIQSIAEQFEMVQVAGPDYRKRDHIAELLSRAELLQREDEDMPQPKVHATWSELLETLQATHPVRYGALLEQVGVLYVEGVSPIPEQNDALRFVHFVDKLYNLKIGLRLSGEVALETLFDVSYRDGAYAKKHYRALSRISELLEETFPDPAAAPAP
ncbi:cell division protein ZapE [soil metagenome]